MWVCLTAIIMAVVACSPSENGDTGSSLKFLWFSDLHFNPFIDPNIIDQLVAQPSTKWDDIMAGSSAHSSFPALGQESNRILLESTLMDLKRRQAHPDIILFAGDFLMHKFNQTYQATTGDNSLDGLQKFIDKTLAYIVGRYAFYFPDTPVHFCLGNNDSYAGDYLISSGDRFLSATAELFSTSLIKDEINQRRFMATYPSSGGYSAILPGDNQNRLIMLNAIFLSSRYPETNPDSGMMQLDWLEETLQSEPGINSWILLHIPPGVDVFATIAANTGPLITDVVQLLKDRYLERLLEILGRDGQHVTAILAGHIHRDDFRMVFSKQNDDLPITFIRTVPAVSPVYDNNPGYKILSVDSASFTILNEETAYLDLAHQRNDWQTEYAFETAYGVPEMTAPWLYSIWFNLDTNKMLRDKHMQYYSVSNMGDITDDTFPYYWQAMRHLQSTDYRDAVNAGSMQTQNYLKSSFSPNWIAFHAMVSSFDSMFDPASMNR